MTLELLHVEYLAAHPTGYRYSAFCARYRAWRARQRLSMRQVHTAGEKAFVDYAGMRPTIVDGTTGEVIAVELFVAVLGASNYTFAEATRTQQSADWILATATRPSTLAASRRCGCRINCAPASRCRAATSRGSSGPTPTGRALPHGRHSGATRETARQGLRFILHLMSGCDADRRSRSQCVMPFQLIAYGRIGAGRFIEVLVLVVVRVRMKETCEPPVFRRRCRDSERMCDFRRA